MKILQKIPKNFLTATMTNSSRLGDQVQEIHFKDLAKAPHGIVVFGIPDDSAIHNVGGRPGAKEAPSAIRTKLYRFTSKNFSFPIYDLGDLEIASRIEDTHSQAKEVLLEIHRAGHLPLVLGGGHDLVYPEAFGLIEATQQSCGFLNIDAHLDLRDTKNGITSGSPWFLLLEQSAFAKQKCNLMEFGIQTHCNSPTLFQYAKQKKVEILYWEKIQKNPLLAFKKALKKLAKQKNLLVSLDIDSVRSFEAPGCSAPQTFGFSSNDVSAFALHAGQHPKVRSFGIYEVSPPLDIDNRTTTLAAHCILAFLTGFEMRK